MRRLLAVRRSLAVLLALAAVSGQGAGAQSITDGSMTGRVFDVIGAPVFDADVTLQDRLSGAQRTVITDRTGRFFFAFLPPGDYDIQVEAVGFRPVRMEQLPVRPGRSSPITIRLRPEEPPVVQIDTVTLPGAVADRIRAGESRWMGRLELARLPEDDRRARSLAPLLSDVSPSGGADGLPPSFTGMVLDGLAFHTATLPGSAIDPLAGMLAPRSFLAGAEVVRPDREAELAGSGGAILSLVTRSGGPSGAVEAFGDYSGGSLWSSQSLEGDTPDNQNVRAGFVATFPIVPDSVHAAIGVETWRLQTPRLGYPGAATALSGLGTAGGLDAPALESPWIREWNAIAAFGRIDWQVGPESSVSVRAHGASAPEGDALPTGFPVDPRDPSSTHGTDVAVAATVRAAFNDQTQLSVKAGFLSSSRTFRASAGQGAGFPQTALGTWPLTIGTDAALPGTSETTQFDLSPVIHVDLGDHRVKAGTGISVGIHQIESSDAALGRYAAGGASGLLFGQGFYDRTEGTGLASDFTVPTFSIFAQDVWNAAPGLQVVFGARLEVDQLPEADLQRPSVWDSLTIGPVVPFDTVNDVRSFGTTFGFTWDVGEANTTFVRGSAGLYYESLDVGVIHDWFTGDGRRMIARDLDPGVWPGAPTALDVVAPSLTIEVPDYRRPRTTRGSVGLTRSFATGLALHVASSFRRTEYLLRRRDLNLTPVPSGTDQFGRPIFGRLVQRGATLGARPSFNRRFPTLDRVYALVTDGWSEYRDVTVVVEKRGGPVQLVGSYTFSKTEDNMVGWGMMGSDARLLPMVSADESSTWDEGLSDFDVPHRLVAGVDVELPVLSGIHLSGVYRFQSGEAFTPGFRPGVDANGDGSGYNDPAFIGGVDLGPVASEWTCLRTQASGPVERNACRGDNVQSLDLRLALGLATVRGSDVQLVVDVLGVIEPELGVRDRALYLVNGGGQLTRAGATWNVPLVANPAFGELARRLDPGRILRVGLRIGR